MALRQHLPQLELSGLYAPVRAWVTQREFSHPYVWLSGKALQMAWTPIGDRLLDGLAALCNARAVDQETLDVMAQAAGPSEPSRKRRVRRLVIEAIDHDAQRPECLAAIRSGERPALDVAEGQQRLHAYGVQQRKRRLKALLTAPTRRLRFDPGLQGRRHPLRDRPVPTKP